MSLSDKLKAVAEQLAKQGVDVDLNHPIGKGTFGRVFPAKFNRIDRVVKISEKPVNLDRWGQKELARGPSIWPLTQNHENLTTLCWVDTVNDGTSEYLCSVWQKADSNLSDASIENQEEIAKIVRMIARGLQFLHDHGVLHRDLKPENILLVKDGDRTVAQVADLGCAKLHDGNASRAGNFAYCHPRQFFGDEDKCHDVFAFMWICIELLWRVKRPGEKRTTVARDSLNDVGKVQELINQLFDDPDHKEFVKSVIVLDGNEDESISALEIVDALFGAGTNEPMELEVEEFEPGGLNSVGLSDEILKRLAGNAISTEGSRPPFVERNYVAFGVFRAKQIAFDLLKSVTVARDVAIEIETTIRDPQETDSDALFRIQIGKITSIRQTLADNIKRDGARWKTYKELADSIYELIDTAWTDLGNLQRGKQPKSSPKGPGVLGGKDTDTIGSFEEKRPYYSKIAQKLKDSLHEQFDDVEQFYQRHCKLLDRPKRRD